jgi:hypothetical protein
VGRIVAPGPTIVPGFARRKTCEEPDQGDEGLRLVEHLLPRWCSSTMVLPASAKRPAAFPDGRSELTVRLVAARSSAARGRAARLIT